MATQYTVKAGDTLSKIGQQFGVDYNKITGYSSGNPNLIRPGEVLSIPVDSLSNSPPQANLPAQAQDTNDYNSMIVGGNAMLGAGGDTGMGSYEDLFKQYLSASGANEAPSATDIYNQEYGNAGIAGYQGDVTAKLAEKKSAEAELASIQAQLQGMTAEQQARALKLREEGISAGAIQGRNIAQERELAIRALPLQAQGLMAQAKIQAAQGNLEVAQNTLQMASDRLNTVYQLKLKDAENQYNYKQKLIDAVYQFATDEQKRKLEEKRIKNQQEFQATENQLDRENEITLKNMGLSGTTGGTIGVSGGNIVTTSTGEQIDISSLDNSFSYAVTNFTKDQRTNAQTTYNGFINRGDIAGAKKYVEKLITDKLSPTQKDAITTMGTVESQIDKILAYNADGKLEGVGFISGPFGALTTKIFGTGSKEAQDVRALVGNIKGTIAKLRGGTSFTPNEEKLLNSYTPNINESANSVITKLGLLKDFITTQKNKTLYPFGTQSSVGSGDNNSLRTKYNY